MSKTTTPANAITFTKLFAQRRGASYATVLNACFASGELLKSFNYLNRTSLALDARSGLVTGPAERSELKREIELFANYVWRDVFLQIGARRLVA